MSVRSLFALAILMLMASASPAQVQCTAPGGNYCLPDSPGCIPTIVRTADGSRVVERAAIGLQAPGGCMGSPVLHNEGCLNEQYMIHFNTITWDCIGVQYLFSADRGLWSPNLRSFYRAPTAWAPGVTCQYIGPPADRVYSCSGNVDITLVPRWMEDPEMRGGSSPTGDSPSDIGTSGAGVGPSCPSSNVGFPVNVTTGNVWMDQQDARVPGVGLDLVFRRSYNSLNAVRGRGGVLGAGWHHNYERRITVAPSATRALILRGAAGVPLAFHDNDDQYPIYWPVAPKTEESWIVQQPPANNYVRHFRRGGSEEYDSTGRLSAIVDRWGNRTTLTWLGDQLTTIRDANGGRELQLGYEGSVLRTLSGPAGLMATYEYQNSVLSKVTYADEQQSGYQFSYWTDPDTEALLLQAVRDLESPPKTLEFHEYYSGTGKGKTSERGDGVEKLTLDYGNPQDILSLGKTKVTDARNNVTWYHFAEFAGLKKVVKIEGACTGCGGASQQAQEWGYNDDGRIISYKDGEGNVTSYTYEPTTGDLETETRKPDAATTLVTSYIHHPDGRLRRREDTRGEFTNWSYGDMGGGEEQETVMQIVAGAQARRTHIWYNSNGKPRLIIDPSNQSTELFYQPNGDLDYIKDPAGKETHFTYDLMGRRTQTINPPATPEALETQLAYNIRGQIRKIIDPTEVTGPKFTEITYDRGGRRIQVQDALQRATDPNRRTEYVYDSYGRLELIRRWLSATDNQTTRSHYDSMSNLEWMEDARGKRTTFEYDGLNRLKRVFYPPDTTETRLEEFTYDGAGRLKTRTDRRGIVTTYAYDGLGRLTGKSYVGGAVPTAPVTFGYDNSGNLTQATDGTTTLSWAHNLTREPVSATQQQVVGSSTIVTSLAYGYDDAGNRTSLDTGLGFSLSYDYDVTGRLWHILRGSESFTFVYDDASRRRSLSYPNGVVSNLMPDSLSRLEVLEVLRGATSLNRFDYGYDDVGNRTSKATQAVTETYGYDEVYQLEKVHRGAPLVEDFGYDRVGNRNSTLALPNPSQWVYSNRNELLAMGSATFTYDLNGNLIGAGARSYEWDAENRLTRVTQNGAEVARYRYDPLGRRVEKLVGFVRTTYVYDGEDIIRERVGTSNRYFVHGPGIDEPLAKVAGSTVTYFHADGLGSIVNHTNGSGTVVYSRSYDAFGGLETGSSEAGYAFTGREWDPETGLYYYRARYYDPKLGRFLSEDPAGLIEGPNLYTYVANRPINLVDPLGLYSFDEFLYDSAQFSAGFGDTLTFGLTGYIREEWGVDDVVDRCSTAYAVGMYVELGLEVGLTGASAGLRSAAKGITQAAARRGMTRHGVRGISAVHHLTPLKSGLFPTAALRPAVRHSRLNTKLLTIPEHTKAHAELVRHERYLKALVNPGTTAGRIAYGAYGQCGCQ